MWTLLRNRCAVLRSHSCPMRPAWPIAIGMPTRMLSPSHNEHALSLQRRFCMEHDIKLRSSSFTGAQTCVRAGVHPWMHTWRRCRMAVHQTVPSSQHTEMPWTVLASLQHEGVLYLRRPAPSHQGDGVPVATAVI
jgi:hypothetical protein